MDSENLKFLELYEQEELLWNFKHKNYKNKDFRDNALKRLQEAFNLTQLEIKNRIKNLRSTYSQELAKIKGSKVSGTSSDEVYKCTLIWFETADRFLRDVIVTRKTSSNLIRKINKKKRKKNDAPSYISTAIDKLEKLKDGIKDTDEFDHFGANIAMQLRNLPIEVSLVVQSKIMNLITKE
ncbi:hypothetical protein RI129_006742 [Pyrocoelia pectoralis]|uniref:MADF domain-containing protein n=1 Tax=Pyrocoelia pectoralis TaxID=417401 RepID=A0AAN7ZJX5_9COLE